MQENRFQNLVLGVILFMAIACMLVLGRSILLPIVTALILIYVLESAVTMIRRLPVLRVFPVQILRLILLVGLILLILILAAIISATVKEIIAVSPGYEENLRAMVDGVATRFHLEEQAAWDKIRDETIGRIDLRVLFLAVLGGFTNAGAMIFLVFIYAAFMIAERESFQRRLNAALKSRTQFDRVAHILADINIKISRYLAFKTLINVILGVISFAVLWAWGVDFALFWAVVIGLLNYIPYVGSYLAVFFPVALSLAQFGSISLTLLVGVSLTSVQFVLGNIVEPRLIGRQLNLSPFVVLLALAVWTTMWGIPGAILAVPLTSILAIVLSSFDTTRWLALLLAERVDEIEVAHPEASDPAALP
ncbi:AI-2E family transporter [Pseudooceanicola algae]|uniref:Transport protein YhhT n=1 Tax=Pseudooceanicola algae TaxID=1537215 RepID=A0A418SEX3_9RHOB|nr:AI-2E family transporter [Pseudooceanicola algae]QPM89752.1 Putative transport protein YhhT [Pseudooceanicola algae]